MTPFTYHRPASVDDAARELARDRAAPMGGGTDLLVAMGEGLAAPTALVDLRAAAGADVIAPQPDGTLRIGGAARVHDVAHHPAVRERWPALAQACEAVGTPTLRHMGTMGGNLCQRPRCWYFRRGISCYKSGGDACPAVDGENQYLAIVDGGPCHAVHPSDPAVALTALEATVEITRQGAVRWVPMAGFYVKPHEHPDRETVLEPGEFVSAIVLPDHSAGGTQGYHKLMQREAWDFALASIAWARYASGDVRMVLGGVAPAPWRVNPSVEEDVASGGLDDDSIASLAERALYDARPLSKNGYKVELAASLLRQAMRELSG
ncbi:MAG TPA: xanthine dehydrogenase family protein subunit M [Gemmatimonadaceae bacterium]|nr:xanthine dehydrogenase family protein subunit M [Gemmatimonadaceae bacterium]